MAKSLYAILGASGHVGSAITGRLLDAGKRVRVVGRSAEKLAPFVRRGAEATAGTVEDASFLRRAFDEVRAAFVMLPPYFGPGIRAWQDRTARAIGDALEAAGVPYAVALSSIGADLESGNGPAAGLHVLERRLEAIPGLASLHLRPGYFFENSFGSIGLIKATGANGGALRADVKMVHVATRDIGEEAARRLLALDWQGHGVQELHGERDLTMDEVTTALGKAIRKPDLRYVQFPYVDAQLGMMQSGLPEELAVLFVDMSKGFNEGRVRATQPRSMATTTPTSIERWAAEIFAPVYEATGAGVAAAGAATHP